MESADWKEESKGIKPYKRLLWDVDLAMINFHKMRKLYVQRVLERGGKEDFYAVIHFYGVIENFKKIIRERIRLYFSITPT